MKTLYMIDVKKYYNKNTDTIYATNITGSLSDAREYAIRLIKRFDVKRGHVEIVKSTDKPLKFEYQGDVVLHNSKRNGLIFTWYPAKKIDIYKLNKDGTLGRKLV